MAVYEYSCETCDLQIETQTHYEVGPDCTVCYRLMKRVWTAPAVQFKGRGFYSTGG